MLSSGSPHTTAGDALPRRLLGDPRTVRVRALRPRDRQPQDASRAPAVAVTSCFVHVGSYTHLHQAGTDLTAPGRGQAAVAKPVLLSEPVAFPPKGHGTAVPQSTGCLPTRPLGRDLG